MIAIKLFTSAQFWDCKAVTLPQSTEFLIIDSKTRFGATSNLPLLNWDWLTSAKQLSLMTTIATIRWLWMQVSVADFKKGWLVLARRWLDHAALIACNSLNSCQPSSANCLGLKNFSKGLLKLRSNPRLTQVKICGIASFRRCWRQVEQNSGSQLTSQCFWCFRTVLVTQVSTTLWLASMLRQLRVLSKFQTTVKMRWFHSTLFTCWDTMLCAKLMLRYLPWLMMTQESHKFKRTTLNFSRQRWSDIWTKPFPSSRFTVDMVLSLKFWNKFIIRSTQITSNSLLSSLTLRWKPLNPWSGLNQATRNRMTSSWSQSSTMSSLVSSSSKAGSKPQSISFKHSS